MNSRQAAAKPLLVSREVAGHPESGGQVVASKPAWRGVELIVRFWLFASVKRPARVAFYYYL